MPQNTPLNNYDVVICGAGLAGLTLGLQLKRSQPDCSILILERKAGPLPAGIHKVGESTTEGGTFLLRELAGLKDYVESTHIKKLGLRFFGSGHRLDSFSKRFEIGDTLFARNTSYQFDRGVLENDLRAFCTEQNIDIEEGVAVNNIEISDDENSVTFVNAEKLLKTTVSCRWVIDATGRQRLLQSKFKTQKPLAHKASSTWWRLKGDFDVSSMVPKDNENWHDRVVPKRLYSTNHLFGPGYFIWIIPLCSNMTSIGIVADESMHPMSHRNTMEKSLSWLKAHEPDLYNFIESETPLDFKMMRDFAYTTTQAFSADRWSCIGEAAAFTDPLYSMGTDLIAIGNRITTQLIQMDKAGTLNQDVADSYNTLYLNVVDTASDLFTDMYPAFGTDDVAILKIMWDIGCYWGFFSQLTIQEFLHQPDDIPQLIALDARLKACNQLVQSALLDASKNPHDGSTMSGFYTFGGVTGITNMRAKVLDKKSLQDIDENILFLEQFADTLCKFLSGTDDRSEMLFNSLSTYLSPVEQASMMPNKG